MKRALLSAMGILAIATASFAQSNIDQTNTRDGESVEYCITHKKMQEIRNNPAAQASLALDEVIRDKEASNPSTKAQIWYIPVVFHVLHNGGVENITDEQVYDAFNILNRDFRLQNADANNVHPDFQGMPSDVEIEFRLATKSPDGTCFKGITRTQNAITFDGSSGGNQVNAIKNGNDVDLGTWPGNNYLNIFIVADAGGAAGYTTTPSGWLGSAMENGIWILHDYVGSIGTSSPGRSRALTHEVGHWLNLEHVWGPNNNPGNASSCNDDDGVQDTPICIGVTSCNINSNSCNDVGNPNSSWSVDVRDNVENYMDYSYCSKMFTANQVTRMRNALNSSVGGRSTVKSAANITNTGADSVFYLCKAEFMADKTTVCAGSTINFTDDSYNLVTGWTWSFTGGIPSSSTSQNPSVTYSTPGIYSVTLTATDGSINDTETKTAYIRVLPASGALPFLEDFEGLTTLNNINEWEVVNEGGAGFELETTTGHTGTKSARLLNNGEPMGSKDELVGAPLDLSVISTNVTMSFRYAYKRKTSTDDDWLRVKVTENCGDSWTTRKTLHGFLLSSDVQSSSFTPSSINDWTTVHVTNIINTFWVNNFRYKFEFEAGGGNNFFLDNINIYAGDPSDDLVVGIKEGQELGALNVYPNPADDELNVQFDIAAGQDVQLAIQDLSGKTVQYQLIKANAGTNLVFMDTKKLSAGMYFLQVRTGSNTETIQIAIK